MKRCWSLHPFWFHPGHVCVSLHYVCNIIENRLIRDICFVNGFSLRRKSSAFSTFPWTEPRNKISQRRVSFYHALYYYIWIFSERIPNDSNIFQVFKNIDKIFNQLFSFRILILSLWNFSISFITSISFSSRSRFNPFFKNCSSSNCEK